MGPLIPIIALIAGGVLIAKAVKKDDTAPKQTQNVRPPADAPDGPGKGPGTVVNVVVPQSKPQTAPPNAPPIPAGTPAMPQGIDPRSAAGNAIANMVQPQPLMNNGQPALDQPPLPQAPPQSALPVGLPAYVSTSGTGNSGALRVRVAPNTTATVIPGGEPESGGGFEHGSQVRITGPLVAGFSPVMGEGRLGGTLTGYAWAGYLTGAALGEVAAANAGNAIQVSGDKFGEDYRSETDVS
jgi:hypothetical protein